MYPYQGAQMPDPNNPYGYPGQAPAYPAPASGYPAPAPGYPAPPQPAYPSFPDPNQPYGGAPAPYSGYPNTGYPDQGYAAQQYPVAGGPAATGFPDPNNVGYPAPVYPGAPPSAPPVPGAPAPQTTPYPQPSGYDNPYPGYGFTFPEPTFPDQPSTAPGLETASVAGQTQAGYTSYYSSYGFQRRYTPGWTPHTTITTEFRPTVHDTGKGSAKFSPYVPRPGVKLDSYDEIVKDCLKQGSLWEDPDFPATNSSIYYSTRPSVWPLQWKRPKEFSSNPEFITDGASRLDVKQGILGDCWLLAAVASLTTQEELLKKVVPHDQTFKPGKYAGIFKFQFWQFGRWVEVFIDDKLPTHNGKLVYMHSDAKNEFWTALLEKAYAKLNGSYESLSGGSTIEALVDFTGGLGGRFELREKTLPDLFNCMVRANKKGALMGCSIDVAQSGRMEDVLPNGLVVGHAYSITDVRAIEVKTYRSQGKIPMVRIRNPWGDSHEWKGAWSDGSREWQIVPAEEKKQIGLSYDHDGEFWMSFDDFKKEFQRLEVCFLGPDSAVEVSKKTKRKGMNFTGRLEEGAWQRRVNAGGCRNFPTFWTNPQYKVKVPPAEPGDSEGTGMVIIGLTQKGRRKLKKEGKGHLTVGYAIYKLDDPNCGTLDKRYFDYHKMIGKSHAFIDLRDMSSYHSLEPGDYVVIPSTFDPNEEGSFLLRIFSETKDLKTGELDDLSSTSKPETIKLGADTAEDKEFMAHREAGFRKHASVDGRIDAYELKDILNEIFPKYFDFEGFSTDLCRGMVAMHDPNLSGALERVEYDKLWNELKVMVQTFRTLDEEKRGFFYSYHFRQVLHTLASKAQGLEGLRISNSTMRAIATRYSDSVGKVKFDDFCACVVKLRTMFEVYRNKQQRGMASFHFDEFIHLTMYS